MVTILATAMLAIKRRFIKEINIVEPEALTEILTTNQKMSYIYPKWEKEEVETITTDSDILNLADIQTLLHEGRPSNHKYVKKEQKRGGASIRGFYKYSYVVNLNTTSHFIRNRRNQTLARIKEIKAM
ncbi:hypothetical protein C2G38_2160805 [Gigaspora rosea]|uniref:Uncharacterized protein n=1 Tax=Gigaspora rosea TaxID=44941 RepID=A0A397W7L9_9GLOM|nr:hypothetical protein C2G38_2160805 [Gigaspora rosea]